MQLSHPEEPVLSLFLSRQAFKALQLELKSNQEEDHGYRENALSEAPAKAFQE